MGPRPLGPKEIDGLLVPPDIAFTLKSGSSQKFHT